MEKVLVESQEYNGQYVAIKSIEDNTIIGSGLTLEEALTKAKKNGENNPYILYVPEENLVHIY